MVTYDEFSKLEIKIGKVLSVEKVEGTDRLLKFEFDFGSEKRTIIGGWAISYPDPSVLVGTLMPVLMNLEPRVIRGIESQGMILSAVARKLKPQSGEILSAEYDEQPVALHPDPEKDVGLGAQIR